VSKVSSSVSPNLRYGTPSSMDFFGEGDDPVKDCNMAGGNSKVSNGLRLVSV